MDKDPIINCHTHTFTAEHVPPFLAKTYIPWPFYYIVHLKPIVAIFRFWFHGPAAAKFTAGYKNAQKLRTGFNAFLDRIYPLTIPLGYYVFFFAFSLLYQLVSPVFPPDKSAASALIKNALEYLAPAFPVIKATWLKIAIVLVVLLFFETIRNFILFLARLLWKALTKLPGPQTVEMFQRYLNIGRYAFHKEQKTILTKLKDQYPKGTRFVILPMDMEYMAAGRCTTRYRDQMEELAKVKNMPSNKNVIHPFVFADPRRIGINVKKEKSYKKEDLPYFDWSVDNGSVTLNNCFLKSFLEEHRFSGIKIYPALGYYPFDDKLLPLWKYCADNEIPVLTHCIRGTIFYRGVKKQDWNEHPVFEQAMGTDSANKNHDGYRNDEEREEDQPAKYIPLVLPQNKNVDFSYNFTNPLNYLCILEEEMLRKVITKALLKKSMTKLDDEHKQKLRELFGYNGPDDKMDRNLEHFKICLGHFGGDDEWRRYFEKDRYSYSSQLVKNSKVGIRFFTTGEGKPSRGKMEQLWKYTDWYSIICSMILKYPNVYADISYILHSDHDVLPLLKQSILNEGLKERILYGTDFFVVRNHKSDKNMLADMMGGLPDNFFDQMARINPKSFLANKLDQLAATHTVNQSIAEKNLKH